MDGVLADFHSAYALNKTAALHREIMANLIPFAANVELVRRLITSGETVYILTKAANEEGKQGKIDWLSKYIPELDNEHFICISKGRKVDYIREEGMLIDDDQKNLRPWRKAGYTTYFVEVKGERINLQRSGYHFSIVALVNSTIVRQNDQLDIGSSK